MSRWIDADRLLEERRMKTYYHLKNGDTAIPIIDIKHAPSIDLVRCGECKYKEICFSEVAMTNKHQTSTIYERIDFCSYGERKERVDDNC